MYIGRGGEFPCPGTVDEDYISYKSQYRDHGHMSRIAYIFSRSPFLITTWDSVGWLYHKLFDQISAIYCKLC